MPGGDGHYQLDRRLVRSTDVAFIPWERLPDGVPDEAMPSVDPSLAVEVLSRTNTKAEMSRKRKEYLEAGVLLDWEIDPIARTAAIDTSVNDRRMIPADGTLDGGEIIPGLTISLSELFALLDRSPAKKK